MTNIKADVTFLHANAAAWKKHRELKRLDPFAKCVGAKRKYENPKELQKHIDQYFDSLMGPIYTKMGEPLRDEDGKLVRQQIKPATLSGLALHLGICTNTLRRYHLKSIQGLIPPEYAEIVLTARQRIENYAEEQVYSKDGGRGAQFVLQAAFGWQTKKEQSERGISKLKKQMMKQDLKMKQKLLEQAEEANDNELKIEIVRAFRGEE